MSADRKVRLIRRRVPDTNTEIATEAKPQRSREPSEREIKTVVSGWVRDHRLRSTEAPTRDSSISGSRIFLLECSCALPHTKLSRSKSNRKG